MIPLNKSNTDPVITDMKLFPQIASDFLEQKFY